MSGRDRVVELADEYLDADAMLCEVCGRESCEDHLPPADVVEAPHPADDPDLIGSEISEPTPDGDASPLAERFPPFTDSGNAEFFAARHGRTVRYDHRRGRWLFWRGHRWQPDADAEIYRLAKDAIRRRYKDAIDMPGGDTRDAALKWARLSEARARLEALLFLARSEHPITDAGDGWDADPYLLGVPNGVVDLRTGTRRPGRRDDRITMSTATPFHPAATCPRWERFLMEVFASNEDLIAFIHRAVGYTLTADTAEQCLCLCYGVGANGKGTLLNTLKRLLGDYAWNMPFSTFEMRDRAAIPNDVAALVGRRFVVASETNDGTRLNESRIKALTGCDPITARFLNHEFFTFEPVAKFMLAVNHKPVVRDDSHGFWRRIRVVPFMQTFAVDKTLGATLMHEAPGILAWAVRGCLAWQRQGLMPPALVTAATGEYEQESDPLAGFIAEALDLTDSKAEVQASDLFAHYKHWADGQHLNDRERLTSTAFGKKMGERFKKGRDTKTGRVTYSGLTRRFEPQSEARS